MLITVNGLVTRSYPSGDHDRVVHILTEEHGRLAVMVKGAGTHRAGRSADCTQLFTYGDYELYRGKSGDLYWLRGGSVIHSFYKVTTDMTRMALAAYLCDIASEESAEEGCVEESGSLLRMLLNSLYAIHEEAKPHPIIKGVFELRTAALMGYCPDLTGCSVCGVGYPESAYLDVMNGCLICADCQTKRNRMAGINQTEELLGERRVICPITPSVLAAMRYALSAPEKKLFSFSLTDPEEERGFERAAETFLLNHLERDFDTLHFYHSVADLPAT